MPRDTECSRRDRRTIGLTARETFTGDDSLTLLPHR